MSLVLGSSSLLLSKSESSQTSRFESSQIAISSKNVAVIFVVATSVVMVSTSFFVERKEEARKWF